jgi:acetyl esterase/lipase
LRRRRAKVEDSFDQKICCILQAASIGKERGMRVGKIARIALGSLGVWVFLGGLARGADATHPDLTYATLDGHPLHLDLYLPTTNTQAGSRGEPFPVVVYIHGGGWAEGHKWPLARYVEPLVARGIAIAAIDYRLTSQEERWGESGVTFPAQIHDVKGAVRWLRAHAGQYGLDPARFAAAGESAGGHLAALLGTSGGVAELEGEVGGNRDQSSRIQAFVDYYGPTNLATMNDDATASPRLIYDHEAPESFESRLIGFSGPGEGVGTLRRRFIPRSPTRERLLRLLDLANPVTHVSGGDPPAFIAHGTADGLVPRRQSLRLRDAYLAGGLSVEYREARGRGHGALGRGIDAAAAEFLIKQLRPGPPGGGGH